MRPDGSRSFPTRRRPTLGGETCRHGRLYRAHTAETSGPVGRRTRGNAAASRPRGGRRGLEPSVSDGPVFARAFAFRTSRSCAAVWSTTRRPRAYRTVPVCRVHRGFTDLVRSRFTTCTPATVPPFGGPFPTLRVRPDPLPDRFSRRRDRGLLTRPNLTTAGGGGGEDRASVAGEKKTERKKKLHDTRAASQQRTRI